MTGREKLEAEEERQAIFSAAHWRCVVCGNPLNSHGVAQLAHRVAKTAFRLRVYGPGVIHHFMNLVPVCGLPCNDGCNIGNRPMERDRLIARIVAVTERREMEPDMAEYYEELRESFQQPRNA